MRLMRWLERFPDRLPNLVLFLCVRCFGYGLSRLIAERDLRDAIAPGAILQIAKARMVRTQLNNPVSIGGRLICIEWNHAHVCVVC